jgi:hypothetical protein
LNDLRTLSITSQSLQYNISGQMAVSSLQHCQFVNADWLNIWHKESERGEADGLCQNDNYSEEVTWKHFSLSISKDINLAGTMHYIQDLCTVFVLEVSWKQVSLW